MIMFFYRAKFTSEWFDVDDNTAVVDERLYGSSSIWCENVCNIRYITNDLFDWAGTSTFPPWISHGYFEGRTYHKHIRKPWHIGKAFSENCSRCTIDLPFCLYGFLFGWNACTSVFLFSFGEFSFSCMFVL